MDFPRWTCCAAFALLASYSRVAAADPGYPLPWNDLGDNLQRDFGAGNAVWYGASVALTITLAETGADYDARRWVRRNVHARGFSDACVVGGYVLPAVLAPGIYAMGVGSGDRKAAFAGAAAVQSLAVTALTVGLLKWGIGRPYPNNGRDPNDPMALEHPEDAKLGSVQPFGPHWMMAWPSGHTAATTSIVAALYGFAPEDAWIGWVGYPLSLTIGAGMIVGDHHWTSDVIAGAMIGHAVGWSTGQSFRAVYKGDKDAKVPDSIPRVRAFQLLPTEQGYTAAVAGTW